MFRHEGLPAQFGFDAVAQCVGRGHVAVCHEHAAWRLGHGAQPVHELARIGVGRGRSQLHDLGALVLRGGADATLDWNALHGLLRQAREAGLRQLRGEAQNQVGDARVGLYGGFTAEEAATLILRRA